MPGIGSLIHEIHVKITEMIASKTDFRSVKPMPAFKVLKDALDFMFAIAGLIIKWITLNGV